MRGFAALLVALLAMAGAVGASAHEIRPAYLEIEQTSARPASESYRIVWKQPTLGDVAVHLVPHLSNGWLEQTPVDQYAAGGFLIRTWRIVPGAGLQGIAGVSLTIEGLRDTITDAFVRVRLLDGRKFEALLHPRSPSVTIEFGDAEYLGAAGFLRVGIEHILGGPDHLLFVLGLLLIVRNRLMLLKTVSAFTLAHSLTLAYATLGNVNFSSALIEALIALSILFLAAEVLRARAGGTSCTIRYPWAAAFLFGLLHGLGFASGLNAAGLEPGQRVLMLVFFNTGVEFGQLAFIAAILLLQRAARGTDLRWPRAVAAMPAYLIGVLGAAWTIQRAAAAFGWA